MPTETTIPTLSTGNVLSAAERNYLTPLNTGVGLFGVTGIGVTGATPPGTTAPNFLIQAGYTSVTFSAASGTLTFPTAFPNGILMVSGTVTNSAGAAMLSLTTASTSTATFQAYEAVGTSSGGTATLTAFNTSSYVSWIAIGW